MFFEPSSRSMETMALRIAARFWGAWPEKMGLPSSFRVASRTQWERFSIPQWLRHHVSISGAPATAEGTLLMAYSISTVSTNFDSPFGLRCVVRVNRQTWAAPGQWSR